MTFDLVENALHSLREAISYYTEADEGQNADQFKFSVLLTCHCAELLLKEILVRNHPALIYEDIDKIGNIDREADRQTVGYRLALLRVKNLCGVDLKQYEDYLVELGQTRNTVQHYADTEMKRKAIQQAANKLNDTIPDALWNTDDEEMMLKLRGKQQYK